MRSHQQLWHTFTAHLHEVLPDVHRARVRTLALLTLGLLWAEAVALPRVARAEPFGAHWSSVERRLARFVANPNVDPAAIWTALLPRACCSAARAPARSSAVVSKSNSPSSPHSRKT